MASETIPLGNYFVSIDPIPPGPVGLTASASSGGEAMLGWQEGGAVAGISYEIYRSPDGSGWTLLTTISGTAYTDSTLDPATTYYYRVRAVLGGQASAWSATVSASTSALPPSAVTGLSATPQSPTAVSLTWINPGGSTGLQVYRKTGSGGSYAKIADLAATATTYADATTSANTTYFYKVTAVNDAGSTDSTEASTLTPGVAPNAPSGLVALSVSPAEIDLSWTDTNNGGARYQVDRSPNGSGSWVTIGTTAAGATTFPSTGLAESTTYYFRLSALANSQQSSYVTIPGTTQATPAQQGLTATLSTPDGNTYVFDQSVGTDLGSFVSPYGFTQQCVRVTRNDTPLTVYFRPDRDSDRAEVVFENFRMWSGTGGSRVANRTTTPLGRGQVNTLAISGATGGTFTVTVNGKTTGNLAYNATAAQVQAAVAALSTVVTNGATNVTVTGTPTLFTLSFTGSAAGRALTVTANGTGLTGTTPAVAVNQTQAAAAAYTAVISRGGTTLATVSVPTHWWGSRWRWQSAPRPVVANVADLKASNKLLPFDLSTFQGVTGTAYPAAPSAATYAAPMDTANIYQAMPATGERPDIGPYTDCQSHYILTGNATSLSTLRAQAEACGSIPIHIRDEDTGAPPDFYAYPHLNWYGTTPIGVDPARNWISINLPNTGWQYDVAHDPTLAYVPYLLTGDPYYLEEIQFQAQWDIGWEYYQREQPGIPHTTVYTQANRILGWGLRNVGHAAVSSPASPPSWLKSRGYWEQILSDNLTSITDRYVNSTLPEYTIFHAATRADYVDPWMDAYLCSTLGWLVNAGYTAWRPVYEWFLWPMIQRTNGTSGWDRQWCAIYSYVVKDATHAVPTDWTDLWNKVKAGAYSLHGTIGSPLPSQPAWPDFLAYPAGLNFGYLQEVRSVLAQAALLNVAGAKDCHDYVNAMVYRGSHTSPYKGAMIWRWAFATPTN